MDEKEIIQIIISIFVLGIVFSFSKLILLDFSYLGIGILFSFLIISTNILGKKIIALKLDASVKHEIWLWRRYGFKPNHYLKNSIPFGIIVPLFISAFSLGIIKFMSILTYETSALKRRAAKKHGCNSFTEMTDKHNAYIGATGILTTLTLAFIVYWIPGLEELSRMSAFYVFWNMIPISKLDGCQIIFGNKTLWAFLAVITLIFAGYALLLI